MITVDITGKRFGDIEVLGRVTFTLRTGEVMAITGPSGIGKTTLLRILAGLDPDFEGRVGVPDRLAIVFQEPTLLPWRSAQANIIIPTGVTDAEAKAKLAEVGLAGLGDRFPGQLSLGQQRRLALARAFAGSPELLLMDEPFVSLDRKLVSEMLELTAGLLSRHNITSIIVTHDLREARALADRVANLEGEPACLVEPSGPSLERTPA